MGQNTLKWFVRFPPSSFFFMGTLISVAPQSRGLFKQFSLALYVVCLKWFRPKPIPALAGRRGLVCVWALQQQWGWHPKHSILKLLCGQPLLLCDSIACLHWVWPDAWDLLQLKGILWPRHIYTGGESSLEREQAEESHAVVSCVRSSSKRKLTGV